jgi:hypothetical protein
MLDERTEGRRRLTALRIVQAWTGGKPREKRRLDEPPF